MKKYRYIISWLFIGLFAAGCEETRAPRKIRLATDEDAVLLTQPQVTTTIQLEPKARRSIAILSFKNKTGDKNLGWLQKGLTEMFIRSLSQSNSISIISSERLLEIIQRLQKENVTKLNLAALIAQEANVEVLLTGSFTQSGDSLTLNINLHEPQQGMIFKEEAVQGKGLENLFDMVDELSGRIKEDLLLSAEKEAPAKGIAELSSNSLEAWRHYTAALDAQNKFLLNDAQSEIHQALAFDSTFIGAYLELATIFLTQNQWELGQEVYQKAIQFKEKATPPELFRLDWFGALFRNDFEKLVEINRAWINQYPNDRDANMNMANFYYNQHLFRPSVEYLQKALKIDSKYTPAINQLGYAYAHLGQFDQAEKIMLHYKKITSNEANPFDSSGDIFTLAGDFEQAEENYRQALKIRPDFHASWQNLASIYLQQGKYDAALEATRQFLKYTDEDRLKIAGYLLQAAVYWRRQDYDQARRLYDQILTIHPFNSAVIQRISEIFQMRGDTTAARKNLENYYGKIAPYTQNENQINAYQALQTLFELSAWNDIRIAESIQRVEKFRDENPANRLIQVQTRFMLQVLYIKNHEPKKLETLWEAIPPEKVIVVLREMGNFSFTNLWSYFVFVNQYYAKNPDTYLRNYTALVNYAAENNLKMVEIAYRMLLADFLLRTNQASAAAEQLKIAGVPLEDDWMLCGPFENANGFNQKFPPEKDIDLTRSYSGEAAWKIAKDSVRDGFVNFKENIKNANWAVGYGLIYLDAPKAQTVQFRSGSNESIKIWLNDREVWKMNAIRTAAVDADIFEVNLRQGRNKILVKVCNSFGNWGYYFRVCDSQGNGIPALEFVSPQQVFTAGLH